MLSRKIILKYAMIASFITVAFIIWIYMKRGVIQPMLKVYKLSSGYTSILVSASKYGVAQTTIIGAGESFDVVRKLGESLPLFQDRINYLVLTSDTQDISGAIYVIQRFKVDTIIMRRPVALGHDEDFNLAVEVGLSKIYKIAAQKKIPVMYTGQFVDFNTESDSSYLFSESSIRSPNNSKSDTLVTIKSNSVPRAVILGRTNKTQSRLIKEKAVGAKNLSIILFQTLNPDNIDIDSVLATKPRTILVSAFLRSKSNAKSVSNSKSSSKIKTAKKSDYKNIDIERLLGEKGIEIKSLEGIGEGITEETSAQNIPLY